MPFFELAVRRPLDYYEGEFYSADFVRTNSWNGSEKNFAYLNLDGNNFLDIGFVLGIDSIADSRSFIAFDFDHDGDQDLLVANRNAPAQLFVNHWADNTENNWLKVRLVGDENRSPVGATVKVHTENRIQAKTLSLCNSYLASYAGPLLFGIGTTRRVDAVEVLWPGGTSSRIEGIAANQEIELRFPSSTQIEGGF